MAICLLIVVLLATLLIAALPMSPLAAELRPPIRVMAADQPIDVDLGHAAPCFADLDGDGLKELLVGQFGGGKLRVYKNVGQKGQPRFTDYTYLQAEGQLASVPWG